MIENKDLISIGISLFALAFSGLTYINYKKRYIKQKAYEWSVDKVIKYLEITENCWKQSTIVHSYISILTTKVNNEIKWNIKEEEALNSKQMLNYRTFNQQLQDLYYFFNNEINPLVKQVLDKDEMKKCFKLLDLYKPFTLSSFIELEKENNFKQLSNDIIKIKGIIASAIAKQIG